MSQYSLGLGRESYHRRSTSIGVPGREALNLDIYIYIYIYIYFFFLAVLPRHVGS